MGADRPTLRALLWCTATALQLLTRTMAIACALFFPVLGSGTPLFTETVRGNVSPLGVSVVVGAFLFGIGMQLGDDRLDAVGHA